MSPSKKHESLKIDPPSCGHLYRGRVEKWKQLEMLVIGLHEAPFFDALFKSAGKLDCAVTDWTACFSKEACFAEC